MLHHPSPFLGSPTCSPPGPTAKGANTTSLLGQRLPPTRQPSRAAPRVEPQQLRPLAAPQQQISSVALGATTPSMDWEATTYFLGEGERIRLKVAAEPTACMDRMATTRSTPEMGLAATTP